MEYNIPFSPVKEKKIQRIVINKKKKIIKGTRKIKKYIKKNKIIK